MAACVLGANDAFLFIFMYKITNLPLIDTEHLITQHYALLHTAQPSYKQEVSRAKLVLAGHNLLSVLVSFFGEPRLVGWFLRTLQRPENTL